MLMSDLPMFVSVAAVAELIVVNGEIVLQLSGDLLYFYFLIYRMGGIIPPVARDLHKKHVEKMINLALERASVSAAVKFEFNVVV